MLLTVAENLLREQEQYASDGNLRIIALYTKLTSLKMSEDTVTDCIIKAETAVTSLRNVSDTPTRD